MLKAMMRLLTMRRRELVTTLALLSVVALVAEILRASGPASTTPSAIVRALLMAALGFGGGYSVIAFQVHNRFAPRDFVRSINCLMVAFFSLGALWFTVNSLFSAAHAYLAGTVVACSSGAACGGVAVWAKHFAAEFAQGASEAGNLTAR